ncbi:transmembrane protein 59, partial [Trichonephila inaurata madagascariensis]
LENLLNESSSCELQCEQNFSGSSPDLKKSCSEGCRLYTVIGLAKDVRDYNKTVKLCESACSEAFINETVTNACSSGCNSYPAPTDNEEIQTLHLLTPLMYVRSAYNSMAHHVKQFISTSWTVYVQEDSGKMVILQTSPKVVESLEYSLSRDDVGIPPWFSCCLLTSFSLCGFFVTAVTPQSLFIIKEEGYGVYSSL